MKKSAHMQALEAIRDDARKRMAGYAGDSNGTEPETPEDSMYEGGKSPAVTIMIGTDDEDDESGY